MARHFNTSLTQEFKDQLGFKQDDTILNQVVEVVSPVVSYIQPVSHQFVANFTSNLVTLDTKKDFYVTNAIITCVDTLSTMSSSNIYMILPSGAYVELTSYVYNDNITTKYDFQTHPIKLKRGSIINFVGVHEISRAEVFGYYLEVN